jgi:hypothetical protein
VSHLEEEHRLRVSENRVLRGIFGPKSDEGTGDIITNSLSDILG